MNTKVALSIIAAAAIISVAYFWDGDQRAGATQKSNEAKSDFASMEEYNAATNIASLSVSDFSRAADTSGTVILDVRTPAEYADGHIRGALNIDFRDPMFSNELAKLDKSKTYAVYCRSGNRSGQALQMMKTLGFINASDLSGGIIAWLASGEKVECGEGRLCQND